MIRQLILAAGFFCVVSACGTHEIQAEPDVQAEVASLRQRVYALADLAATDDLLAPAYPRTLDDLTQTFEANEGAVWCWGAAYTLLRTYAQMGYETYVLSFGVQGPDLVTHAVTLVRVGDELYIQDPYLNLDYAVPLYEVVEQLARGTPPPPRVSAGLRDVHVNAGSVSASWAVADDADCSPMQSRPGVVLCRSEANYTLFERRLVPTTGLATLDRLESMGYPRDFSYLLLQPYEIFDGVNTVGVGHPIIDRILEIAAAHRAPAAATTPSAG